MLNGSQEVACKAYACFSTMAAALDHWSKELCWRAGAKQVPLLKEASVFIPITAGLPLQISWGKGTLRLLSRAEQRQPSLGNLHSEIHGNGFCRGHAQRLHEAILRGEPQTAAGVLEAHPGTAHIRHHTGDFAIHLACRQVRPCACPSMLFLKCCESSFIAIWKYVCVMRALGINDLRACSSSSSN